MQRQAAIVKRPRRPGGRSTHGSTASASAAREALRRCVVETLESRTLLSASFKPLAFTDPFPTPAQQGQAVAAPAWTQSFEDTATFGAAAGVLSNGWSGYAVTYPSFATPAALQGAKSAMTVEFWTKGRTDSLLKGPGFTVTGQGGQNSVAFTMAADGVFVSKASAILPAVTDGKWHHYVVTNDCRYVSSYLDGELYSRYWIGGNTANQIGPMQDGTNAILNPNIQLGSSGSVDELRLYNVALTPLQVKQNFENYRAYATVRYVSPSGAGTGSGLDTNNPMSLTSALALVGPDTKLILKGGYTYTGSQFQLSGRGGTSANHDALIIGEPGAAPAIIKVTSGSVGPTITGGGYITLRNLQFNNATTTTSNALNIETVPNPVVIDSCTISSDTGGLRVNASPQVKVQNTAVQVASTGINVIGSASAIIRNNTINGGTLGIAFTSSSTSLKMVNNLISGQTSKCLLIDSSSTASAIADNNAYGPSSGVPFATLAGINYSTAQVYDYQLKWYNLSFPGDSGWNKARAPEQHSFIATVFYDDTTTSNLDLELQRVSGNVIDTGTSSTLSDFGSSSKVEPALYDATGAARPLPFPFDNATSSGGTAMDVGAYETAPPTQYQYTLTQAATTSAGVCKTDGTLVRTLWSGRKTPAGNNVAYWNGLDDKDQPVAAGTYQIKVLASNVNYVWEGAIGNTSPSQTGPTTQRPFFTGPAAMAADPNGGTAMFVAMGYQEAFPPIWRLSTASPSSVLAKFGFQQGTNSKVITDVATDGTRAYFASSMGTSQGTPCAGFITAWSVSDNSQVTGGNWAQIDGGNYYGIKVGNPGPGQFIAIAGVAAQYNTGGNLLFVSVPLDNKVYVYNKTTGAKQATELAVANPGDVAVTSSGDLWVVSGSSVLKFSASNGWASPVKTVSGLAGAVAIGYTPCEYGAGGSTGTLLVADGGGSQQVKAFRNDSGASLWTYGRAGGYADGPAVASDKFQFGDYRLDSSNNKYLNVQTYLTPQTDGSFWVYDMATQRTLKFDASRVMQPAGTIGYMAGFVAQGTDRNDPTRVFGSFIEYKIDYSKPLAPDNGSWVPMNYWGHDQAAANYGFAQGLVGVTTLKDSSNVSHTYAISRAAGQFVELTSMGLRMTGITLGNSATGTPWWLEADGSLTTASPVSPTSTFYKRAFTGINLSTGNPTWGATTVVGTAAYSSNGLFSDPVYVEAYTDSASGLVISHNPGASLGNHLGAIANGGSKWLWQALPTERLDGRGSWDSNGSQVGADHITGVVGRSIFITFRGEFWDGVQANQVMQYYDDGLFIGQFGQSSLLGNDSYVSAVPGQSSNMMVGSVVQVDGKLYLYACDESSHGGVSRYRVDGMDSLVEFTGVVSTNNVPAPPSDLSASAISSSQINLTWTDNATNETGFKVERATDSNFTQNLTLVTTTAASTTMYSDTGLSPATTYYYRVRGTNGVGDSLDSNTASAVTFTSAFPAPGNLIATAVSATQVNLTWTDTTTNETGFRIEWATDSGFTQSLASATVAANVTSYSVTGLTTGTTYYFRVRAIRNPAPYASIIPSTLLPSSMALVVGDNFGSGYTFANPIPSSDTLNGQSGSASGWSGAWAATNFYVNSGDPYNSAHNYFGSGPDFPLVPGGSGYPFISKGSINGSFNGLVGNAARSLANAIAKPASGSVEFWFAASLAVAAYSGADGQVVLQDAAGNDLINMGYYGGAKGITAYTAAHVAVTSRLTGVSGNWHAYVLRGVWQANGDIQLYFWLDPNASDTLATADKVLTTAADGIKLSAASISKINFSMPASSQSPALMADDVALFSSVSGADESSNSNTASATPVAPPSPLIITGDQDYAGQNDTFRLVRDAADPSLLDVFINNSTSTPSYSLPFVSLSSITVSGLAGNDSLILDASNGPLVPGGGLNFDGGAGNDSLTLAGGSYAFSSDLGVDAPHLSLALTNGAQVAFSGVQHLGSLSLSGSAKVTLADGGQSTLVVQSLTLGATSSLDVADNAVIVDYTGSSPFAAVYSLVASSAGNHWAGNGIVSHTAAGGGSQYAIGVVDNSVANLASFGGQTVDGTSVLIRFTYSGDANLDGQVDLTDLSILAGSWQMAGRQWSQGDMDYSGLVDLTDLVLLASNWQKVLPAPVAAPVVSLTSETASVATSVDAAPAANGVVVTDPTPAQTTLSPVMATASSGTVEASVESSPVAEPMAAATKAIARIRTNPGPVTRKHPVPALTETAPRSARFFSNRPLPVASALASWPITGQGTRVLLWGGRRSLIHADDVMVSDAYPIATR